MKKVLLFLLMLVCAGTVSAKAFFLPHECMTAELPDSCQCFHMSDDQYIFLPGGAATLTVSVLPLEPDSVLNDYSQVDALLLNFDNIQRRIASRKTPFYRFAPRFWENEYVTKDNDTLISRVQLSHYEGHYYFLLHCMYVNPTPQNRVVWEQFTNSLEDTNTLLSHGICLFAYSWIFWIIMICLIATYSGLSHKQYVPWFDHLIFGLGIAILMIPVCLIIYGWDLRAIVFYGTASFIFSTAVHWGGDKVVDFISKFT